MYLYFIYLEKYSNEVYIGKYPYTQPVQTPIAETSQLYFFFNDLFLLSVVYMALFLGISILYILVFGRSVNKSERNTSDLSEMFNTFGILWLIGLVATLIGMLQPYKTLLSTAEFLIYTVAALIVFNTIETFFLFKNRIHVFVLLIIVSFLYYLIGFRLELNYSLRAFVILTMFNHLPDILKASNLLMYSKTK